VTSGKIKLKGEERIEAKQAVRECILSRLSRAETLSYVKAKMKRDDLEVHHIDTLKATMKADTKRWMKSLMKDRWAYVSQYKDRVDEYLQYKKEYWRIFFANSKNPYVQKVTLDSLQNVSAALTNLYDILPEIAGASFVEDSLSKTAEDKAAEIRTRTVPPVR
jgi:hypothetical protein